MVEMLKLTLDQYLETQAVSSWVENEKDEVHIYVYWCK